ncbi:MAG: hypothetical protein LC798_21775 [Chloroflexi bacterium]|nr:hypothetical protein [Chloroflexota bacterium]
MADEHDYDSRRIDGLMSTAVKHDVQIDAAVEGLKDLRRALALTRTDLLEAVAKSEERQQKLVEHVAKTCEDGWAQYQRDVADAKKRAEKRAEKQERSTIAKYGLIGAIVVGGLGVVSSIIAAAAVIWGG